MRRDWVLVSVWMAVLAALAASSAAATARLYPDSVSLAGAAAAVNRVPALVALYGRVYDPASLGALAMLKMGVIGSVFVAVLTVLLVVRYTRADEEMGRLELLRATVLGRQAPLSAALLVGTGVSVGVGLLAAGGLVAAGLPAGGSVAFGLSWSGVGLAFSAVGALGGQLVASGRAAVAVGSVTLAAAYLARAAGDTVGPGWLTWVSPLGWVQQVRPYAGDRWWALLPPLGVAALLAATAYAIAGRRDLGGSLLADRRGSPVAAPWLRSPLALAWRLQWAGLACWVGGFAAVGAVVGLIATGAAGLLDTPQARELIARLGGSGPAVEAVLAAELSIAGVVAAGYLVQAMLRVRAEEVAGRADAVLATAVGRLRWAAGQLTVVALGGPVLLVAAGAAAGATYAAQTGKPTDAGWVLLGGLAQLPAAWLFAGLTLAAIGLVPRWAAGLSWGALVAALLLAEVGPVLRLPTWLLDASPYRYLPKLPGGTLTWPPLLAVTAVGTTFAVAGLVGLTRRDLG